MPYSFCFFFSELVPSFSRGQRFNDPALISIKSEKSIILDNGIRFLTVGETSLLPEIIRHSLDDLISASSSNTDMTLCLCLSYGGREEIVSMVRDIALSVSRGEFDPASIDEDLVSRSLWSSNLGPVDLMIRTSGELRISNFLLWSLAYSELYFCNTFWPDFNEDCLNEALFDFSRRQRRFGALI